MLYQKDFFLLFFFKVLLHIFSVEWGKLKKTTRFMQGFAYLPESSAISLKLSTMKSVEAAAAEDDEVEGEDVGRKELISSGERVMGGGGE